MTEPAAETVQGSETTPVSEPTSVLESAPAADSTQWRRVSPSYVWVDLVGNIIPLLVVGVVWVLVAVFEADVPPFLPWLFGAIAVLLVINAAFGVRRVRAIGYQLRDDDLLFRRGIMFERIVAVPYGRMQLIDTHRGPVLRALGLTNLKFVTAAAATNVQLPGLKDEDAMALRDQLVNLAEMRRSGL